ncbi:unnamed protein product [Sphagnum jensenii]
MNIPRTSVWSFLEPIKTSGSPLPRTQLVRELHRRDDSLLLGFVTSLALNAIDVCSETHSESSLVGAQAIVSWYTSVVVNLLVVVGESYRPSLTDAQLRALSLYFIPGLQAFMRSSKRVKSFVIYDSWRLSSYILLAHVSVHTKMSVVLLEYLHKMLFQIVSASIQQGDDSTKIRFETFHILCKLADSVSRPNIVLSEECLELFFQKSFIHCFLACAEELKLSNVSVHSFASIVVGQVISNLMEGIKNPKSATFRVNISLFPQSFNQIVTKSILSDLSILEYVKNVLMQLSLLDADQDITSNQCFHVLSEVIIYCSRYHSTQFDTAVNQVQHEISQHVLYKGAVTTGKTKVFNQVLQTLLQNASFTKYNLDSNSDNNNSLNLLMALNSVSVAERIQSISRFVTVVSLDLDPTPDLVGLVTAASRCLVDPEILIAEAAWRIEVLERIAQYVEADLLFETCFDALNYWYEFSKVSPSIGAKIIKQIIESMSGKLIVSKILNAKLFYNKNDLVGSDWLVLVALATAEGTLLPVEVARSPSDLIKNAHQKTKNAKSKSSNNVAVVAHDTNCDRVINLFMAISSSYPIFKEFQHHYDSSSDGGGQLSRCTVAVSHCLIKRFYSSDNCEVMRFLHSTSIFVHSQLDNLHSSIPPYISPTLYLCVEIQRSLLLLNESSSIASVSEVTAGAHTILAIFVSLLLRCATSRVRAVREVGIKQLLIVTESYNGTSWRPHNIIPTTATSIVSMISSDICSNDVRMRILTILLSSTDSDLCSLTQKCLSAFFTNDAITSCLRIAAASRKINDAYVDALSVDSFIPKDLEDLREVSDPTAFVRLQHPLLEITNEAKIGALKCINAWVTAFSVSVPDQRLLADHADLLVCVILLLLHVCGDEDVYIRKAAVEIAQSLYKLKSCCKQVPPTPLNVIVKVIDQTRDYDVDAITAVAGLIRDNFSIIMEDCHAITALLSSHIFWEPSLTAVSSLLLESATYFSTVHNVPEFCQVILNSLRSASIGFELLWPYCHHILKSQATRKGEQVTKSSNLLILSTIVDMLSTISSPINPVIQSELTAFIFFIYPIHRGPDETSIGRKHIQTCFQDLLSGNWADVHFSVECKEAYYTHFLQLILSRSTENLNFASFISAVRVNLAFLSHLFSDCSLSILSAYNDTNLKGQHKNSRKKVENVDTNGSDLENEVSDSDHNGSMEVLSSAVRKAENLLEITMQSLRAIQSVELTSLSTVSAYQNLRTIVSSAMLLCSLFVDGRMKGLFDYSRGLWADFVCFVLDVSDSGIVFGDFGAHLIASAVTKKQKRGQTTNVDKNPLGLYYTRTEWDRDVLSMLEMLKLSSTIQAQSSLLRLLKSVVKLDNTSSLVIMSTISEILAASSILDDTSGKEHLIKELLRAVNGSTPGSNLKPQQAVQSLLLHCRLMSSQTTRNLLLLILDEYGFIISPVCVCVLLTHVYACYISDSDSSTMISADKDVTVLLSVAAQKKARKHAQASLAEQIFQSTIMVMEKAPLEMQIYALSIILEFSRYLMSSSTATKPSDSHIIEVLTNDYDPSSSNTMLLDCSAVLSYYATVSDSLETSREGRIDIEGLAITLGLLGVQVIAQVLENASFVRLLNKQSQLRNRKDVNTPAADTTTPDYFQISLLQFSDSLLQLYTLSSLSQNSSTVKQGDKFVTVQLREQQLTLNLRAFGDNTKLSNEVESTVVTMTIELSVKLTENELKSFLARLGEWQDVPVDADHSDVDEALIPKRPFETSGFPYKTYTRNITFYHYMAKLGEKLKSIFSPLMALSWDHAIKIFNDFMAAYKSLLATYTDTGKKMKKSRINNNIENVVQTLLSENKNLEEQRLTIEYALSAVSIACRNDSEGFIDEVGDDYLALLPECLPFLSELLEDDSTLVTDRARDTAKLIEELSGESIENYMG